MRVFGLIRQFQQLSRYQDVKLTAKEQDRLRALALWQEPGEVEPSKPEPVPIGPYRMSPAIVRCADRGEQIPVTALGPADMAQWNRRIVIWVDRQGKKSLLDASGKPGPAVAELLKTGTIVVGVDLLGQGEFTPDGKPLEKARMVNNDYAGYTFGYNHPLFAQRVHDILSLVSCLARKKGSSVPEAPEKVYLVGLNGAGRWVAAAMAQAGDAVDGAVIDAAGFRFEKLAALDDPDFLPGAVKYGDLPGMIALSAPRPVWLAGEGDKAPEVVAAAYQAAGKAENLTVFTGRPEEKEAAAVKWLLR